VLADNNATVLATYTYGDSNERLVAEDAGLRTYYACDGSAEYVEAGSSTAPAWSRSYVYLGGRLLATLAVNGSGGEAVQYHHPDRLGTRLVTDPSNGTSFEQVNLPFGTALYAESTGQTNRRFTSYDRSETTKLDYAVNRHYDAQQGRFTQVDPAGMGATSLASPQTLNLYAYCINDPINHTDPSGLGFFSFLKKIFTGIAKVLTNKWVLLIAGIALGVLSGLGFYLAFHEAIQGAIVNTAYLWKAIGLAAMSALLIVGAFHPNLLRVTGSISSILGSVQGLAGLLNGGINGGMWGTPTWNPNGGSGVGPVSHFTSTSGGGQQAGQNPRREWLRYPSPFEQITHPKPPGPRKREMTDVNKFYDCMGKWAIEERAKIAQAGAIEDLKLQFWFDVAGLTAGASVRGGWFGGALGVITFAKTVDTLNDEQKAWEIRMNRQVKADQARAINECSIRAIVPAP
jgi:RHS repeat-associated protein